MGGGGTFVVVVYMQGRGFNSFASNKIKLAVNGAKWSTLLARTRALVLYISISGPKSYRDFRETGPWPLQGTAFHVAVKSGQIPLWTSQRMEENYSKRSKDRVCIAIRGFRSILFLLVHCVTVVVTKGFWIHIEKNSAIFTKFSFRKIVAIQEKTLACVKVAFRQNTYK